MRVARVEGFVSVVVIGSCDVFVFRAVRVGRLCAQMMRVMKWTLV